MKKGFDLVSASTLGALTLLILLTAFAPISAWPHGKAEHPKKIPPASKEGLPKNLMPSIQKDYATTVRLILVRKCADCHGSRTSYPWYSRLPGVTQLIESDIAEAKEHFDFSRGFPFAGHGSVREDLQALAKTAGEGSMPPMRYRALHWDSGLTSAERAIFQAWTERTLASLES